MNSLPDDSGFCKRTHRAPSPSEVLEERLKLGMSAPDQELFHRAETCGRWLREKPWMRPRCISRLRAAASGPLTMHLWPFIEPILLRSVSVARCQGSPEEARQ
jgi:hypothetical protein